MKMNKLIGCSVIALSMVAGQAFAACNVASDGSDPVAPDTDGSGHGLCLGVSQGNFVDKAFPYQMSNNVGAATNQSNIAFFVHTAHKKGMYSFGGTSNGGSVAACESTASTSGFGTLSAPATGSTNDGCS